MCEKYIHAAKVDKCGYFSSSTNWPRSSSFMFSGKEKNNDAETINCEIVQVFFRDSSTDSNTGWTTSLS